MNPHTLYLICSIERTGSSLLADGLARTGVAGYPREYFHPGFLRGLAMQRELSRYANYFAGIIQAGTTANGVWGGKMHWSHMEGLMAVLRYTPEYRGISAPTIMASIFPNLRYIWLIRQDRLRQAISLLKAQQTNTWREIAGQTTARVPAAIPTFDAVALDGLMQEIMAHEIAWQHYFAACGAQPYTVTYEDLHRTHAETIRQILRFLDIDVPTSLMIAAPRLKMQADVLSEEWVQRYHALRGTPQCANGTTKVGITPRGDAWRGGGEVYNDS